MVIRFRPYLNGSKMFRITLSIKRRRKWIKHFYRADIHLYYKETELGGRQALAAFIERRVTFQVPGSIERRTTARFVAKNIAEDYFRGRWR